MSRRTAEASKAIRKAWENEQQLVAQGKGTRDWTEEQQKDILDENKGKAYDENGKAFEGHHMQSAEAHPDYQGDPGNIQFLTRQEHKDAHGGNFHNPTNGYYDPITHETTDFGDGKFIPCKEIKLTNPIAKPVDTEKPETDKVSDSEKKDSDNQRRQPSEGSASPTPVRAERKQETGGTLPHSKPAPQLNWFEKGVKFLWDHRKVIAKGVGIAAAGVAAVAGGVAKYEKSKNGGNSDGDYARYDDDDSNGSATFNTYDVEDETEELTSERNYPDTHASPKEHVVPPHRQRYGKDKHWVDVDAYPRGGKKDNDE